MAPIFFPPSFKHLPQQALSLIMAVYEKRKCVPHVDLAQNDTRSDWDLSGVVKTTPNFQFLLCRSEIVGKSATMAELVCAHWYTDGHHWSSFQHASTRNDDNNAAIAPEGNVLSTHFISLRIAT